MGPNFGYFLGGIGVVLLVAEIFVPSFFLFPIGLGAIGAGVLAYFSVPTAWVLFSWSLISVASWLLLRRAFLKMVSCDGQKSWTDSIVGKQGRVITEIKAYDDSHGRVKVYGDEWVVINDTDLNYQVGQAVDIVAMIGNKVKIKLLAVGE